MEVQLTNAGSAKITAAGGPIELSSFKLGSAFNYTPEPTDTDIHGTLEFQGTPTPFGVVNPNVVKYSAVLEPQTGPFPFGEIGLYTSDGELFALGVSQQLIQKLVTSGSQAGNSIRIDIYLSIVGQNYDMWFDIAESNNPFRIASLATVDLIPPSANAVPNTYIVTGASSAQSSFLAYTDRSGLWNFDCYQYTNQIQVPITGASSGSVTIALSDYESTLAPAYFGQIIIEFSSGALYSICRYVTTAVVGPSSVTFSFLTPLAVVPQVGDSITFFGRQALSTTTVNLPVATPTSLGAIKVGTTLNVTADGTLNVNASSYPVLSVAGRTGNVVLSAADISGLATVATSGRYSDLIGAPGVYVLPVATTTTLGGVRAPTTGNLTVAGNGVIDLGFAPVKSVNGTAPDVNGNVTVTTPGIIGLVTPFQITNGSDLNTYQTAGIFFILDADAPSILNAATLAVGGTLDVEPFTISATGGDVIQRFTTANSIYVRRYSKSTNQWSTWVQFQTTASTPVATRTTTGVVQIGNGLNVTTLGVLSTQIQSVNGKTDQSIVLSASDVGALGTSQFDQQNGVPQLDAPGTSVPATDPYTWGRIKFWNNTLGTWWTAGKWDASANHVIQSHSSITTSDTNTSLASNGLQTIDISYGGQGRLGIANPDYQTVNAEGAVYEVTVAGSTALDGYNQWDVGDLAVCVNGRWKKVPINFTNYVFSAGTF